MSFVSDLLAHYKIGLKVQANIYTFLQLLQSFMSKRHHLEMHYKRMSMLYYKLNGFNPSLKHVFVASLPSELQPELQRQLTAFNLDIANVSLGKIFQLTMLYLDKICEQKDFFKDLIEQREPFASACKKPYLKIQCKDDKTCTCLTNKKKHFHKSSSKKPKKP